MRFILRLNGSISFSIWREIGLHDEDSFLVRLMVSRERISNQTSLKVLQKRFSER